MSGVPVAYLGFAHGAKTLKVAAIPAPFQAPHQSLAGYFCCNLFR